MELRWEACSFEQHHCSKHPCNCVTLSSWPPKTRASAQHLCQSTSEIGCVSSSERQPGCASPPSWVARIQAGDSIPNHWTDYPETWYQIERYEEAIFGNHGRSSRVKCSRQPLQLEGVVWTLFLAACLYVQHSLQCSANEKLPFCMRTRVEFCLGLGTVHSYAQDWQCTCLKSKRQMRNSQLLSMLST